MVLWRLRRGKGTIGEERGQHPPLKKGGMCFFVGLNPAKGKGDQCALQKKKDPKGSIMHQSMKRGGSNPQRKGL